MSRLADYEPVVGGEVLDHLVQLARPLAGARLLQVNSTRAGGGVAEILHRLGYSCLSPRPRHEHHDEQAQQHFKETAPLLSTCSDASPVANADASACTSWTKHDSDSRAR